MSTTRNNDEKQTAVKLQTATELRTKQRLLKQLQDQRPSGMLAYLDFNKKEREQRIRILESEISSLNEQLEKEKNPLQKITGFFLNMLGDNTEAQKQKVLQEKVKRREKSEEIRIKRGLK
jgi:hypothetical protein